MLYSSLEGTSVKIGTIQRRLAWPLRKDDTHFLRWIRYLILGNFFVLFRMTCVLFLCKLTEGKRSGYTA